MAPVTYQPQYYCISSKLCLDFVGQKVKLLVEYRENKENNIRKVIEKKVLLFFRAIIEPKLNTVMLMGTLATTNF